MLKDLRGWGRGSNVGDGLWARQLGPYFCTQPFLRPGWNFSSLTDFSNLSNKETGWSTSAHHKSLTPAILGSQQHRMGQKW